MSGTGQVKVNADERLEAASTEIRRERRRTLDEWQALQEFAARIRDIETEDVTSPPGPPLEPRSCLDERSRGFQAVKQAYEATVMSVPHYQEEYDDGYAESVAAEFGPDVATAVHDRGRFDAWHKQVLLTATRNAIQQREDLLAAVDREVESLEAHIETVISLAEDLSDIKRRSYASCSYGQLDAYRVQLDMFEEKCESVLDARQEEIFTQRRHGWLPSSQPDIATYFYQNLDAEYPIISVIADILNHICGTRARIERAMY